MHFVVLHAEFVLGESQGAARSPLRGDPGGLRPPSAALRAAGAAPFPPRRPAKDPVSCLGRPLQTAGFSPQGSRPADGFGGRGPPTAPRSGAVGGGLRSPPKTARRAVWPAAPAGPLHKPAQTAKKKSPAFAEPFPTKIIFIRQSFWETGKLFKGRWWRHRAPFLCLYYMPPRGRIPPF